MRKVVFGGANSLDNYFARKDDAVDWLMWSDEVAKVMADYFKTFDTMVMGRRTYEVAIAMGQGDGSPPGMKTYVFSRTLKPRSTKKLEITSEDVADVVRRLKQEEGKDICIMGGGLLAKSLFEADLIDEIGFNIHPVLLGSGIPLFYEMNHQIDLELIDCHTFKTGCVMVTYRVKHEMDKKKATAKKSKSAGQPKIVKKR
ncbi:MAG TPA: dihydrofolate reductase family protein [Pyrinomonadaceae bacterium]|nr:dihydrofolate reductase family protein [Pyrinomonadaceae bacterium]